MTKRPRSCPMQTSRMVEHSCAVWVSKSRTCPQIPPTTGNAPAWKPNPISQGPNLTDFQGIAMVLCLGEQTAGERMNLSQRAGDISGFLRIFNRTNCKPLQCPHRTGLSGVENSSSCREIPAMPYLSSSNRSPVPAGDSMGRRPFAALRVLKISFPSPAWGVPLNDYLIKAGRVKLTRVLEGGIGRDKSAGKGIRLCDLRLRMY